MPEINNNPQELIPDFDHIDLEEFNAWKEQRVTKAFFGKIGAILKKHQDEFLDCRCIDNSNSTVTQTNMAEYMGRFNLIKYIQNLRPQKDD